MKTLPEIGCVFRYLNFVLMQWAIHNKGMEFAIFSTGAQSQFFYFFNHFCRICLAKIVFAHHLVACYNYTFNPYSHYLICQVSPFAFPQRNDGFKTNNTTNTFLPFAMSRSEEHTSELQSRQYLVCRLL